MNNSLEMKLRPSTWSPEGFSWMHVGMCVIKDWLVEKRAREVELMLGGNSCVETQYSNHLPLVIIPWIHKVETLKLA